jgi:hypothetical protein
MKTLASLILVLITLTNVSGQLKLDVETGLAFEGYNDVRIPNISSATEFSFTEDFELQGPVIPYRIALSYTFAERNHLIALYAPLGLDYEGAAPFDINFQQSVFEQGQFIEGFYKFNSYRLTYRRDLLVSNRWILGAGFTAKIRDARVQLTSGEMSDRKDDLGFVPLLHLFASYGSDRWSLVFSGDGLAGGPGRAFDLFLGGMIPVAGNLSAKAGYRFLEGGADVSEVYNFTLVNFAVIGVILKL